MLYSWTRQLLPTTITPGRGLLAVSMDADARATSLIDGLPKELVLLHVLPRLPWYTRPVCRAISKSWRAFIDASKTKQTAELDLKNRHYQLPLLRGLFLVCTSDLQVFITRECASNEKQVAYYAIERQRDLSDNEWRNFNTYQMHRRWRKLPRLQGLLPSYRCGARLIASAGRVYVWSDDNSHLLLKMDMGCGDWTWKKLLVPHPFNADAVGVNGKIYIPRASIGTSPSQEKEEMVLVYDMMTDQPHVETWNCDNLRMLQRKSSCKESGVKEELYSLKENMRVVSDGKLELLVYDTCQDSWGTYAEMPCPKWQWSELPQVQLLNGDCFEPASEMGTNTVWIDYENEVITWFDASISKAWVHFDYDPDLEGRDLEYLQFIHGSLYAIFCEDEDMQGRLQGKEGSSEICKEGGREEEEDERLWKRSIRKGSLCMASTDVVWEELYEIGYFEESFCMGSSVDPPIFHFTLMA
ncbi:hypothetical protein GOP47_0016084 [Adiantum capillus-veneris]|uniref:F-box domain-containing protein n=1 Tax=Adiantum capillus-veneris TaxID=13818 RepID=A0A9D4UM11_ADICA|nr:hypothetical protein GOP47_0016084 [Adiantum capillus-veneris]